MCDKENGAWKKAISDTVDVQRQPEVTIIYSPCANLFISAE